MCCFSQPVKSVSSTNIFARSASEGRQYVVYSMHIDAKKDLAMVLPLPVKKDAGEDDVQFIDLKDYPYFFSDLDILFRSDGEVITVTLLSASVGSTKKLKVHAVGDFEASFVPTIKDFSRLDERFRLPSATWKKLPQYNSFGFAVFKLKPGTQTVHPMAFSFSPADSSKLFFPTVHIHDGKIHMTAGFDHKLYAQPNQGHSLDFRGWKESKVPPDNSMQTKSKGIVSNLEHCYGKSLNGRLPNQDTWLAQA